MCVRTLAHSLYTRCQPETHTHRHAQASACWASQRAVPAVLAKRKGKASPLTSPPELARQLRRSSLSPNALLNLVGRKRALLDIEQAVAALRRLSREGWDPAKVHRHTGWYSLLSVVDERAAELTGQQLAEVLEHLGTLGGVPEQLLARLARVSQAQLPQMEPEHLCSFLEGWVALSRTPGQAVLLAAEQGLLPVLGDCSGPQVCSLVYASARLGHAVSPAVLAQTAQPFAQALKQASAEEIARMLWAWARLGFRPDRKLLDKAVTRCSALKYSKSAECAGNLLWALGSMAYVPSQTFLARALAAFTDLDKVSGLLLLLPLVSQARERPDTLLVQAQPAEVERALLGLTLMAHDPGQPFVEAAVQHQLSSAGVLTERVRTLLRSSCHSW